MWHTASLGDRLLLTSIVVQLGAAPSSLPAFGLRPPHAVLITAQLQCPLSFQQGARLAGAEVVNSGMACTDAFSWPPVQAWWNLKQQHE
jgi:hypothetical protein